MGRRVYVIGIGPGGFGQLTLDAVEAMNHVDVFLVGDHSDDQPGPKTCRRSWSQLATIPPRTP